MGFVPHGHVGGYHPGKLQDFITPDNGTKYVIIRCGQKLTACYFSVIGMFLTRDVPGCMHII